MEPVVHITSAIRIGDVRSDPEPTVPRRARRADPCGAAGLGGPGVRAQGLLQRVGGRHRGRGRDTHGAVYSQFRNKQDLFFALYEQTTTQRAERPAQVFLAAEGTLRERMKVVTDWSMVDLKENPDWFLPRTGVR